MELRRKDQKDVVTNLLETAECADITVDAEDSYFCVMDSNMSCQKS